MVGLLKIYTFKSENIKDFHKMYTYKIFQQYMLPWLSKSLLKLGAFLALFSSVMMSFMHFQMLSKRKLFHTEFEMILFFSWMQFLMSLYVHFGPERPMANFTFKISFTFFGMNKTLVLSHIGILGKSFLAKFTLIRFFTSMYCLVLFQITWLSKSLPTVGAFEWFFTSMMSFMNFQMVWKRILFGTEIALIWFFSCMGSLMILQIDFSHKRCMANITLKIIFTYM